MADALNELVDTILAHRNEPIILTGLWAQHMAIIRRARELGIPDGAFHPKSYISAGGGVKGVSLPPDYIEQVDRFWGPVIRGTGYGMTEMLQLLPRCEQRRYHCPPGLIMLLLDQPGEHSSRRRRYGGRGRGPLRLPRSHVRGALGRPDLRRQGADRLLRTAAPAGGTDRRSSTRSCATRK